MGQSVPYMVMKHSTFLLWLPHRPPAPPPPGAPPRLSPRLLYVGWVSQVGALAPGVSVGGSGLLRLLGEGQSAGHMWEGPSTCCVALGGLLDFSGQMSPINLSGRREGLCTFVTWTECPAARTRPQGGGGRSWRPVTIPREPMLRPCPQSSAPSSCVVASSSLGPSSAPPRFQVAQP